MIDVKNLHKAYGDHEVLKGVNEHIEKGEKVVVIGPSGSGKSTFLRCLNLLEEPTSGEIIFEGQNITSKQTDINLVRRRMGMVFQQFNLFPHLTVRENIKLAPVKLKVMTDEEADKRALELLARVGLPDKADSYPAQLSGGQQQRIAIARALVNEPDVLLLDEPLGALDLKLRKEMQLELKAMQQQLGITFIYVTHDQEEALTMSDTIVVMNSGRILQIGPPKTIYDEPKNAFVARFIGESNIIRGTMVHDELVSFSGVDFPCVDSGFGENVPVDVVIRPEDIVIVGEDIGQLTGTVTSVLFKGVHYEMMIDAGDFTWKVHSTTMQPAGSRVGLAIVPFNIHIMRPMKEDVAP